ncbi:MarR family transcriptional regulator [Brevibacterium renqingii]|uniref:MarR family transcriptional regulator n=1 Tax=Brevibacterium renqingii TaxID=2776916 RepID=UPI001ADF806D|nr:MarR family transcriptional regulator [Brevibacterium renqingii]
MFVMTVDQRESRRAADAVPAVLQALEPVDALVPFSRTIGDEAQGVLADPSAVAEAVRRLAVVSGWHIGIGIGEVERPLPETTVEARGQAVYAARQAVEAAKSAPGHLVVRSGIEQDRSVHPAFAEAALRLLVSALEELRSQSRGYVGFRLDRPEATQTEIAEHFDVSQQAVSRVLAQGTAEIVAGGQGLAAHHLGLAEGGAHVD